MLIPRRKPYFNKITALEYLSFAFKNTDSISFLEEGLQKILHIPNPVLVGSGRIAFKAILKNLNLKKGSEIILPALTFGLMKNVIEESGFKPVVADVDKNSFQISLSEIKKKTTSNTSAILATHIFGHSCDIKKITRYAKRKRIIVIEDCAESLGDTVDGKPTGTFGNIAFSSFNIAKSLQGIGGGVIFGNDKKTLDKIKKKVIINKNINYKEIFRSLTGYYISKSIFWPVFVYITSFKCVQNIFVKLYRSAENRNFKLIGISPFYAFLVLKNLESFPERIVKKQKIETYYKKGLSGILDFQKNYRGDSGNGYMIVAKTNINVFKLRRFMAIRGIDIAVKNEVIDDCANGGLKNAGSLYNKLVALPVYEDLSKDKVSIISKYIRSYFLNS